MKPLTLLRHSAALLLLPVAGCAPTAPKAGPPTAKVVFLQADSKTSWDKMYTAQMAAGAKAHAADFIFTAQNADGDEGKQLQQFVAAIAEKPKAVMISPISEAEIPELDKAAAGKGVFIFLLDKWVKGTTADAFLGTNESLVSGSVSAYYGRQMRGRGPVLLVSGPADSESAKARLVGVQSSFKDFKVVVAGKLDCGGDEAKAKQMVSDFLKSGKPVQDIIATNEDMAIGAGEAVQATGVKVQHVIGMGATTKKILDAVSSGLIFGTETDPAGGPAALDMIPAFIAGQKPPKYTSGSTQMLFKYSVQGYVQQNPILGG